MAEMEKTLTLDDFPAQKLEDWISQATRDLKGKPLDTLEWEIEPGLISSAYLTSAETTSFPTKPHGDAPNAWRIASGITIAETSSGHDDIMRALEGGVSELQLTVPSGFTAWEQLLEGVYLDMVAFRIVGGGDASAEALLDFAKAQGKAADFEAYFDGATVDCSSYPRVRNLAAASADESLVAQLAQALFQSKNLLEGALAQGASIDDASAKVHWMLPVGSLYFPELAKCRAARALYAKLIHVYAPEHGCTALLSLSAFCDPEPDSKGEQHSNLVRCTSAGLSAVAGGVDSLALAPFDKEHDSPEFARMLSRNIQHVLWQESHLAEVGDPAKGSHYIEHLTNGLCSLAWSQFQTLCAQ